MQPSCNRHVSVMCTSMTGKYPAPLQQRASRYLCGIHVIVRAFQWASAQHGDEYHVTVDHIDFIRCYVSNLLYNKDTRVCYGLTLREKKNNDLRVTGDAVPPAVDGGTLLTPPFSSQE